MKNFLCVSAPMQRRTSSPYRRRGFSVLDREFRTRESITALSRTPNRLKPIFGIARAAQLQRDSETAKRRYEEFLTMWRTADAERPELAKAREFLRGASAVGILILAEGNAVFSRRLRALRGDGRPTAVRQTPVLSKDNFMQLNVYVDFDPRLRAADQHGAFAGSSMVYPRAPRELVIGIIYSELDVGSQTAP